VGVGIILSTLRLLGVPRNKHRSTTTQLVFTSLYWSTMYCMPSNADYTVQREPGIIVGDGRIKIARNRDSLTETLHAVTGWGGYGTTIIGYRSLQVSTVDSALRKRGQ
jgi:hypothetical protein